MKTKGFEIQGQFPWDYDCQSRMLPLKILLGKTRGNEKRDLLESVFAEYSHSIQNAMTMRRERAARLILESSLRWRKTCH